MTTGVVNAKTMPMSFRRGSREIALQILFQREFNPSINIEDAFNLFLQNFEVKDDIKEFAEFLVDGVVENQKKIDSLIQTYSKNWKMQRMAMVDKNILRIGAFEIVFNKDQVPSEVAINEAIEIAKRYSSQDSPPFINGVLDNILKSRDL